MLEGGRQTVSDRIQNSPIFKAKFKKSQNMDEAENLSDQDLEAMANFLSENLEGKIRCQVRSEGPKCANICTYSITLLIGIVLGAAGIVIYSMFQNCLRDTFQPPHTEPDLARHARSLRYEWDEEDYDYSSFMSSSSSSTDSFEQDEFENPYVQDGVQESDGSGQESDASDQESDGSGQESGSDGSGQESGQKSAKESDGEENDDWRKIIIQF
ncbi:Oidioi.mRNA.OKI2018_I69.YSR.g17184.t1.cds [Oikopleura dioica]|uniref:Oidioi.mRNA.OKI2018_I69.YSR.g17184.t1.cds n=1 Tax=Oikopleura dioica TaxID=34765 RepID=A0ABN7SIE2_OIKDI|nr:Oidioi.mRNA.OKI2018_I69.YSR.g17184.t1.cds [Oikopleura dioica]